MVGAKDEDHTERIQKGDAAAAVEHLTDGERVLRVDNSHSACLTALADEAGIDDVTGGKLTTEQLGIVLSELRAWFPSSPTPVDVLLEPDEGSDINAGV